MTFYIYQTEISCEQEEWLKSKNQPKSKSIRELIDKAMKEDEIKNAVNEALLKANKEKGE